MEPGWLDADIYDLADSFAEIKANMSFREACRNRDLAALEDDLRHGRDPNLPIAGRHPLWYVRKWLPAVKLLMEYGAIPQLYGFLCNCKLFCFTREDILEIVNPYLIPAAGTRERGIKIRLRCALEVAEKRRDLCHLNGCDSIEEYNRTAEVPVKKYFITIPFIHTLRQNEREILKKICQLGELTEIHVAMGCANGKYPNFKQLLGIIPPPRGAINTLDWVCTDYSIHAFTGGR